MIDRIRADGETWTDLRLKRSRQGIHAQATPLDRRIEMRLTHPGTIGAITLAHIRVDHSHLNYRQLGFVFFLFYAEDWISSMRILRVWGTFLVLCQDKLAKRHFFLITFSRVNRVRLHPTDEAEHLHLE
jgi:hypothetical protein